MANSNFNDVVYILGNGSTWGNNEIKYSLRSVEMYLQEYRNVYIIGHKPYFLNDNVIHIPYKDIYKNRARNIMCKINRACMEEQISDNFMLFNDDYFLLKPFSATNYPYYWKCDLDHSVKVNLGEYEKHCRVTRDLLISMDRKILNFDTHKPIIYNKRKFRYIVQRYDWNIPFGYIVKSLYCNHYWLPGVYEKDCKISHPYTMERIQQLNEGLEMFSTGEKALNVAMQKYMKQLYPNKSRFET